MARISSSSSASFSLVIFLKLFRLWFLVLCFGTARTHGASFNLINNCGYTVWPGLLSGAGTAPLSTTGFELQTGESKTISVPSGWSGRMWGRTLCSGDPTGNFSCVTADCGSGTMECSGGATPPATLAEFTLDGAGGLDFYDVSLVDGYNLPMLVQPQDGTGGNCSVTGCVVDLNNACPSDLKVTSTESSGSVACKSACEAFGDPQYCCSGAYANPNTCKPSSYSEFFKSACPRAYSYAYDDGTSTFTCANANYLVTFCPSTASGTSRTSTVGNNPQAAGVPTVNDTTMIFLGDPYASGASSSLSRGGARGLVIAVTVFAAIGRLWLLF